MTVKWDVIGLEEHNAAMNMGIDESLLEHVRDGSQNPTMRFYRWNPSAVSIGRFQGMEDEVNVAACRELGIDVVRRITGGGAVYHDYNGELTYSVIAPEVMFPKGIRESYGVICGWIISGLGEIGIESQFAPINDIIAGGRKISGNAQTRREGVLLQHGTILYSLDVKKMFSVLNVSKEKISDKMIKSVEERVTSVSALSGAGFSELYKGIMSGFTEGKDCRMSQLGGDVLARAVEISAKYASQEWNASR